MAKITFYGGANEIGGNKILVEADGARVWLDFGMSYKQSDLYFDDFLQPKKCNGVVDFLETGLLPKLPDMSGLYRQDYLSHADMPVDTSPVYDAVLLSHAHGDHANYIHFLRPDIPIYASDVTKRILATSEEMSSTAFNEFVGFKETFTFRPKTRGSGMMKSRGKEAKSERDFRVIDAGKRVEIGGLTVEALALNHSIPGSLGYLIHTSSGVIAYTGDIRFHGYDGQLSRDFVARVAGAKPVALICEGTRLDQAESDSEQYVRETVSEVVCRTRKLVIANYPWKDIERLRSFHEVAKVTGRKLALSLKQAYMLKQLAGTNAGAPALDDANIAIYIDRKNWGLITKPEAPQDLVLKEYKAWEQEFLSYPNRVTCDDIHSNQAAFIVRIDFFDLTDLINIQPDEGSCYVRSVTEPFDEEGKIELKKVEHWLRHFGLFPYTQVHASGHASGPEINALVQEIKPRFLFPVHTECPDLFVAPQGTEIIVPELGKEYAI